MLPVCILHIQCCHMCGCSPWFFYWFLNYLLLLLCSYSRSLLCIYPITERQSIFINKLTLHLLNHLSNGLDLLNPVVASRMLVWDKGFQHRHHTVEVWIFPESGWCQVHLQESLSLPVNLQLLQYKIKL